MWPVLSQVACTIKSGLCLKSGMLYENWGVLRKVACAKKFACYEMWPMILIYEKWSVLRKMDYATKSDMC